MQAVEAEVDNKYAAIDASLQDLLAQMSSMKTAVAALQSRGAVKSVQRGMTNTGSSSSSMSSRVVNQTIKSVDVDKAVVLIEGTLFDSSGEISGADYAVAGGRLTSPTNLAIGAYSRGGNYAYWQVIEFY